MRGQSVAQEALIKGSGVPAHDRAATQDSSSSWRRLRLRGRWMGEVAVAGRGAVPAGGRRRSMCRRRCSMPRWGRRGTGMVELGGPESNCRCRSSIRAALAAGGGWTERGWRARRGFGGALFRGKGSAPGAGAGAGCVEQTMDRSTTTPGGSRLRWRSPKNRGPGPCGCDLDRPAWRRPRRGAGPPECQLERSKRTLPEPPSLQWRLNSGAAFLLLLTSI